MSGRKIILIFIIVVAAFQLTRISIQVVPITPLRTQVVWFIACALFLRHLCRALDVIVIDITDEERNKLAYRQLVELADEPTLPLKARIYLKLRKLLHM